MNIFPLTQNNFSSALALLKENNLPTEDISETTKLFVLEDNSCISGTVAIEYSGQVGLLRSLSVNSTNRSKGLGKQLVDFIENFAKREGVKTIYLLTTTAEKFFLKQGYGLTDRNTLPAFIRETSEFSSVCPSTAIVMKKDV